MNPRLIIIALVALAVLGTGFFLWYQHEHPLSYLHQGLATTSPDGTTRDTATPVHITEAAAYYDIDAAYPSSTPFPGSDQAIATMKTFEQDSIAQFKKDGDFANLTPEDIKIQGLGPDRKYALQITYEVHHSTRTITYVYLTYADTLGAHPNSYYRTFTFDTQTGTLIPLSGLFLPGTDYLTLLSKTVRAKLPAQLAKAAQMPVSEVDMDYMNSGTTPEENTFLSWYVEASALVLVFPPYQVAPYVYGAPEVSLPLSTLPIKPEYK